MKFSRGEGVYTVYCRIHFILVSNGPVQNSTFLEVQIEIQFLSKVC